jgi:hypothetical protein
MKWGWKEFRLLTGVAVALASSSGALSAVSLGDMIAISGATTRNQHAAIDSTPDASKTAIVWDGELNGSRRIFLRERIAGEWLKEVILDNLPSAENINPAVDIDEAGTVHVAWLGKVNGKLRVFYAFRMASGASSLWGIVNPDEDKNSSCDAVSLKADADGIPWITWQTGSGSNYTIRVAHLDSNEGRFIIDTLPTQVGSYNLFPQVFFHPGPVVIWYSAANADFSLVGQKYDDAAQDWIGFAPLNLEKMPKNRLPLLLDHADGTISGLWLDEADFADRVFLGHQDGLTRGAGTIIDQPLAGTNESLSGVSADPKTIATWCVDSNSSGSQVVVAWGDSLPFQQELVSEGTNSQYRNPRATPEGKNIGVCFESASIGDDPGRILYRQLKLQ